MSRPSILVAALWWGSLTMLGFVVVPLLFVNLPTPAMAGAMAAKLFSAQTWVSMLSSLLLLLLLRAKRLSGAPKAMQVVTVCAVSGLLLALLAEYAVAPLIIARQNLKLWHGVGSAMYLVQWLCALIALWKTSVQK